MRRHAATIEFVHVRNEEAGAFAAGAGGQVSGRPTAVLGSSGPGSLHLLNGLYDCKRNGLAGVRHRDPHPEHRDRHRLLPGDGAGADLRALLRFVGTIASPEQMPRIAELAMQAAILERGVGMVILPGDVGAAEIKHPLLKHARGHGASASSGRPTRRSIGRPS